MICEQKKECKNIRVIRDLNPNRLSQVTSRMLRLKWESLRTPIGVRLPWQEAVMTSRLKSSENDQSTNTVVERLRSKPEMTVTDQVYMTEVIYPILSQRHYE